MKNHIRFTISKGEPFTLPYDKALQLLSSPGQLVMLKDEKGNWTGQTINKAHIICTDIDSEKGERITDKDRLLENPDAKPLTEEDRVKIAGLVKKYKPKFL